MPSSWDVYYVVFLSAVLALGIPAVLAVISFLVSPKRRVTRGAKGAIIAVTPVNAPLSSPDANPFALSPAVNQTVLGRRINARFFLGVNAALILVTLILALIPCAGMIQGGEENSGPLLKGLLAIVSIALFTLLGLLYSARKGDLSWITSFRPDDGKGAE